MSTSGFYTLQEMMGNSTLPANSVLHLTELLIRQIEGCHRNSIRHQPLDLNSILVNNESLRLEGLETQDLSSFNQMQDVLPGQAHYTRFVYTQDDIAHDLEEVAAISLQLLGVRETKNLNPKSLPKDTPRWFGELLSALTNNTPHSAPKSATEILREIEKRMGRARPDGQKNNREKGQKSGGRGRTRIQLSDAHNKVHTPHQQVAERSATTTLFPTIAHVITLEYFTFLCLSLGIAFALIGAGWITTVILTSTYLTPPPSYASRSFAEKILYWIPLVLSYSIFAIAPFSLIAAFTGRLFGVLKTTIMMALATFLLISILFIAQSIFIESKQTVGGSDTSSLSTSTSSRITIENTIHMSTLSPIALPYQFQFQNRMSVALPSQGGITVFHFIYTVFMLMYVSIGTWILATTVFNIQPDSILYIVGLIPSLFFLESLVLTVLQSKNLVVNGPIIDISSSMLSLSLLTPGLVFGLLNAIIIFSTLGLAEFKGRES